MRERKRLEGQLAMENELVRRTGDIDAYFELANEGEAVQPELEREIKSLSEFVEQLETRTMLSEETDPAECHRDCSPWRRGHGISGLGGNADAHVSPLGRTQRLQDGDE